MRRTLLFVLFTSLCLGCGSSVTSPPNADEDTGIPAGETATTDDTAVVEDVPVVPGDETTPSPDTSTPPVDAPPTGGSGCGKAATAGTTNETINVGTTARKYVLSIPAGYDPSKPYMLAFGWHGRTGNGALFKAYSGVEKSLGPKAIFVYPDGLTVTPSEPKDTGWELTPAGRDVKLFDALVTEISGKLCVDSKRIVAFGHSFGGYFSNSLGCARGKVVRAIAPFAGGGPYSTCAGPVAAWIAHAEDDAVVMLSEGTGSRDKWLKTNGCDATKSAATTPSPCVAYEGCTVTTHWCQAKTGGHNWPSYAPGAIAAFFSAL